MNAKRKTMRKRVATIALMACLVLLNAVGICMANPITPTAKYYGTMRQFAAYASCCLMVVILTTGVYLLLWRIVTFPKKRVNSIGNHGLVFAYVVLGLLLGSYYIGFLFLVVGLVKGARAFFEDVRPKEGKLTGIRTAVCVWVYNAVLILLWKPIVGFYEKFFSSLAGRSRGTASEAMLQLFDFVHWVPSRDLIIFLVLCGVWIIALLADLGVKGIRRFAKQTPDIVTTFGLLFTGYWFWYYGGILFYILAWGFTICYMAGFPTPYSNMFLPGNPKEKNVKRDVAKLSTAEIIKELEESGENVDRTLSLRELRKKLVRIRLDEFERKE